MGVSKKEEKIERKKKPKNRDFDFFRKKNQIDEHFQFGLKKSVKKRFSDFGQPWGGELQITIFFTCALT